VENVATFFNCSDFTIFVGVWGGWELKESGVLGGGVGRGGGR